MDAIELRTRTNDRIPNNHNTDEFSIREKKDILEIKSKYSFAKFRTEPCGFYNCLGLVFASRRARVFEDEKDIYRILTQDNYKKVEDVMEGDIIIYWSNNKFVHCGLVVAIENGISKTYTIVSKWGNGHEVIHKHQYCYYWDSDTKVEFFRIVASKKIDMSDIIKISQQI